MSSAIGTGGLADTTRSAMKVAGGFIINVRSGFGTMSACADFLNETAHYDDPERVSDVWLFMVPTKTPGVTIQNNWDTMSIRCSASNDIVWENVLVPDKDVFDRPARTVDIFINLLCSWGIAPLDSCYFGIAQSAGDYAVDWANAPSQAPFTRPKSHYSAKSISCSRDGDRAANVTSNDYTDRDITNRSGRTVESGARGSNRVPSVRDGDGIHCRRQGDSACRGSRTVPLKSP